MWASALCTCACVRNILSDGEKEWHDFKNMYTRGTRHTHWLTRHKQMLSLYIKHMLTVVGVCDITLNQHRHTDCRLSLQIGVVFSLQIQVMEHCLSGTQLKLVSDLLRHRPPGYIQTYRDTPDNLHVPRKHVHAGLKWLRLNRMAK